MVCPKCNTTNNDEENICKNCGEVLLSNVKRENNVITISPRKKRKKRIVSDMKSLEEPEVLEDIELEKVKNDELVENNNFYDAPLQVLNDNLNSIPVNNVEVLDDIETLEIDDFDNDVSPVTGINNKSVEESIKVENNKMVKTKKKMSKKYKIPLIIIGIILILLLLLSIFLIITNKKKENESTADIVTNTTFFLPNKEGKYAIFDDNGNKITDFIYTDYSNFNNGGAIVYQDNSVGIVNESGKMTLDFGKYKGIESSAGLYKVHDKDYNYYLIDLHGNILYNLDDKDITTFTGVDKYSILKDKTKKQYDILNNKGSSIINFKMNSDTEPTANDYNEYVSIFYDNVNYILNVETSKKIISFESKSQFCVSDVNENGNIIILNSCSSLENVVYQIIKDGNIYDLENKCENVYFNDNNIICENKDEQNLLDENFEIGIKISSKMYVDNETYAQNKNSSVEFYDEKKNIKTLSCRAILDGGYANNGLYLLNIKKIGNCPKDDFDYEYYKTDGTSAFDKKFKRAKQFDINGVAQVSDDGNKYYLIDENGKKISEEYSFFNYVSGYYITSNNGLKGVVDKTGKEILSCKYSSIEIIEVQNYNLAKVKDEYQRYIIYDLKTGNYLVKSNEDLTLDNHYIEVSKDNKIEYYTYNGTMFHEISKKNS